MLKKIFIIFLFVIQLPAYSGQLEDSMLKGETIFLYLYTPSCGYCTAFNPTYNKLAKTYSKQYTFLKIDASGNYGYHIMKKFGARYVPFVVLMDSKKNINKQISPACLLDSKCAENAVNKFLK